MVSKQDASLYYRSVLAVKVFFLIITIAQTSILDLRGSLAHAFLEFKEEKIVWTSHVLLLS